MRYVIIPMIITALLLMTPTIKLEVDTSVPPHNIKHYEKLYATFTAYNLEESQTDETPTIGAWGDDLSRQSTCIVATRKFRKNTVIDIPFLGKRCKVLDKTSKKYSDRIDILFTGEKAHEEAFNFGIKELEYYIIK